MRLAENERFVAIARAYGERIKTSNVRAEAINQLVKGYPSHGFVIDRDEARNLFNDVREPTANELLVAKEFREFSEQTLTGDAPVIRRLKYGGQKGDQANPNDSDDKEASSPAPSEETDSDPGASAPPPGSDSGDDATQDGRGGD